MPRRGTGFCQETAMHERHGLGGELRRELTGPNQSTLYPISPAAIITLSSGKARKAVRLFGPTVNPSAL